MWEDGSVGQMNSDPQNPFKSWDYNPSTRRRNGESRESLSSRFSKDPASTWMVDSD